MSNIIIGDLIALAAAAFGALFFQLIKETKKNLTTNQSLIFTLIYMQIIFLVLFPQFSDEYNISFDPKYGMFGWLDSENFLYCFFVISLFVGYCNIGFYSYAMSFLSVIVVTNVTLLEPIIAQSLGLILALDEWPGILTYIGTAVTLAGIFMLGKGKQIEEKAMQAIESVSYTKLLREYEMGAKPSSEV